MTVKFKFHTTKVFIISHKDILKLANRMPNLDRHCAGKVIIKHPHIHQEVSCTLCQLGIKVKSFMDIVRHHVLLIQFSES